MALAGGIVAFGTAAMVAAAAKGDPLAPASSQSAAAASGTGLAILAFLVIGYGLAFVTVYLRRSVD